MQLVTMLKKMNWNQNRYRKGMPGWSEGWKDYQIIDSKDLDLLSLQNENWEGMLLLSVNTLRCNTTLEIEYKNELVWMGHKKA